MKNLSGSDILIFFRRNVGGNWFIVKILKCTKQKDTITLQKEVDVVINFLDLSMPVNYNKIGFESYRIPCFIV